MLASFPVSQGLLSWQNLHLPRYVFDHSLVLPEYLVEYEYEATPGSRLAAYQRTENLSSDGQAALEKLDFDVRTLARPLVPLLLASDSAEFDENGDPVVHLTGKENGMELIKQAPRIEPKPPVRPVVPAPVP